MSTRQHILTFLIALLLAMPVCAGSLNDCNVVWDSPSADSLGSMPLGNGDVGLNIWVEADGDLFFYISKVDAFSDANTLAKLGRVRLKLTPNPFGKGKPFRQELVLRDGTIEIKAGSPSEEVKLRVWVDAHHPVIRVEAESAVPVDAVVAQECWRGLVGVPSAEAADGHPKLPQARTAGIKLTDQADRLVWAYRNITSIWKQKLIDLKQVQLADRIEDPLLYLTSGCLVQGPSFARATTDSLRLKQASRAFNLAVHVQACRTDTAAAWFTRIEQLAASAAKSDVEKTFADHKAWWRAFWERSYITVENCGKEPVRLDGYRFTQYKEPISDYCNGLVVESRVNARQLTQRYALERFLQAAASRGTVPPPFNGSIFTMDLPAGTHKFGKLRASPSTADGRDWGGLPFFWQNTRHPFWSMLARGDYDTMMPGFSTVRDALEVSRDRCRQWFGHDGAFMTEGIYLKGAAVNVGLGGHLKYHWLGTIEMTAMMCDYFEHTQDQKFLAEILLPCADEFVKFYELHFSKRDERGTMVMEPAGVVETYQPVTNPVTEVSGLRYLVGKLAAFDESLIGAQRKQHWTKCLGDLPEVPWRTVKGVKLLAPGEKYQGRLICETPELYAVWPFQQVSLASDAEALARARQSFHVRQVSLDGTPDTQSWETGGWQSAPIWAAYLGLPREAARLTSINFDDRFPNIADNAQMAPPVPGHPRARFPGFWETKMDYTPDNDHGAVSANALQSLLLQSVGEKMFLLPAWPEDWDVSFKLHAAFNTTVNCVYRDGKVQSLNVEPPSRRADIVDMSTLENRIQTLIAVACADRNYLFGLPPMLDAQPKPGKTTGPWFAKYGESVTGVRAAPWPRCVFRDNIIYVHGSAALPPVPAKLISSNRLSSTILKLEYDRAIEPFALAAPSRGSLTAGKTGTDVDLGKPVTFDRVEVAIENPDHKRGDGKRITLEAFQADGTWQTIYQGAIYGTILSKRFDPVTAQKVRLVAAAPVRQFDLFPAATETKTTVAALQVGTITLTEPLDYQVIQRTSRTAGTMRVRGMLTGLDASRATIEVRTNPAEPWRRMVAKTTHDSFDGTLELPAGGWFRLEVRALLDGKPAAAAAVEHVGVGEVFVMAGQSNSANHGAERQSTKTGLVTTFDGKKWRLANDPQPGASGGGGSFMPPFGDAMAEHFHVPVGIIACGIGATSVREWLPKGKTFPNPPTLLGRVEKLADGQWSSKGDAFQMFVARMKFVGPRGFRAVLWHQGESDANQKDPTRTLPGKLYREYLEKLIRDSRSEIGWDAPWFVAQVSYHVPGDEASPDIRAAQASLWGDGIALEGPDSDALKGDLRERGGKGVHFSGPGLRVHAAKWAEKVRPWLERELQK